MLLWIGEEHTMSYQNYERWKTTPLIEEPYLSVIIPAYNEEERILPTIGAVSSHMCDLVARWELIIVDDGSSDQTAHLVAGLGLANLRLLKAPKNEGKGSATQRGMLAARGTYVLFTDADNSTPIEEVAVLFAKLEQEGYDIAVGSRAALGAEEASRSILRRILSYGLRSLVHTVFRFNVRDTQCGFKMYTRETARRLHIAQTIKGFSFDLEVLYLAAKLGYRVAEVPVKWVNAPGSKVDATKEVRRFLHDLVTIKLNDVRGVYAKA